RGVGADPGGRWRRALTGISSHHAPLRGVWHLGFRRYGLPRPEGLGLLACERPAQGLQAECRRHGGVHKTFPARVAEVRAKRAPGTPIEVWCQDEMRVGQKNKLTYRWARKGSRPSSCVRIGCQTGSSNPSTISSTIAVTPGTRSSISPGRSCPSRAAIGRAWVTQCEDWYYSQSRAGCNCQTPLE